MKKRVTGLLTIVVILILTIDTAWSATKSSQSVVGIVRSDYTKLKNPAAPDAQLTDGQIEDIVRWATKMAEGLQTAIKPDAKWIAIKVNIVEVQKAGSGVITDPRVVKAVVKLVHEAAPNARISIAEGPGEWISPDVPGADKIFAEKEDGWEVAGYRDLLKDQELKGIRLDLVDLNVDQAILTPVPGQWFAREKYWMPKTVLECDALIDVPVMKIHEGPGMTCAMKNFVGIAPGLKYGWPKLRGYPGQGPGIPHTPRVIDETLVDLTSLAKPAFTVVDAIVGMEKQKTNKRDGRPVRMNTVIAGSDIVAVDATCARVMGLNPDDFEFLTLATRKGLGQMDEEQIKVNGQSVEEVAKRFEKIPKGESWSEMGHYGQGNRTWILKGPFPTKEFNNEFIDPKTTQPTPGKDGWSKQVYFSDDRIDLDKYFDGPTDCVVYGYAEFVVPKGGPAELWVGSDEGLAVWIDGKEAYRFAGSRRHRLPNAKVPINLADGNHQLLIKAGQSRGRYDFSLNICEPEKDPRYEGNRLKGLKFRVPEEKKGEFVSVRAEEFMKPSDKAKVIEKARWMMNPASIVGAIEGGLKAMGDSLRPTAYLTGVTGYAFRLTVSDSLSWDDPGGDRLVLDMEEALKLCRNLGYDFETVTGNAKEPGSQEKLNAIWERVIRDIDRGVPVIVQQWGCFLIRGHDPRKGAYIVSGWDEDELVPFDEIANEETEDFNVIFFGERHPVNTRDAEMASLRFAVEHARIGDTAGGRFSNGFRAYERWIRALENNTVGNPWAHAFHTMLLLGARQSAAAYLDTLAGKYEGETASHLRKAAEMYGKEVESLKTLNQTFGFDPPGKPDRVKDAEEQKKGVALLKEALKWEEEAIKEIEDTIFSVSTHKRD